jgi:two-component system chemotaxis response regulator CheB
VLAIASSTGGVWVLAGLLQGYRRRATTAVLVAQHLEAEFVGFFADWLASVTGWPAVLVEDEAPLEAGRLYLAGGGRDLVAEPARVLALPAASRYVPCADRLLASVARAHGARARAAVHSGMGADGAAGLSEVARCGGRVACQAPATAVVPSMPESALRLAPGAEVASPEALGAVLARS